MRKIDSIIIHCSATKPDMNIGAAEIRDWHVSGNGWADIGYHFVIRRNGMTETGRPIEKAGAHAYGHNASSIGICLVGGIDQDGKADCNYTHHQWTALKALVRSLTDRTGKAPGARVLGHRDVSHKACPCFNVSAWWHG